MYINIVIDYLKFQLLASLIKLILFKIKELPKITIERVNKARFINITYIIMSISEDSLTTETDIIQNQKITEFAILGAIGSSSLCYQITLILMRMA